MTAKKMKISISNGIYHKIFYSVVLPILMETNKIDNHEIQSEIKRRLILLESYLKEIKIDDIEID